MPGSFHHLKKASMMVHTIFRTTIFPFGALEKESDVGLYFEWSDRDKVKHVRKND